jgi:hypothetical protein
LGVYIALVGLGVALAFGALVEYGFFLQHRKLDSIEKKLDVLMKFEKEHHPK